MDRVIEISELRQVVHPVPDNRFAAAVAFADRLEHWTLRPDLAVAIHAGLRRRQAGERRRLHRRVAVTAVDARAENVMAMAEGHGLVASDADAGHVVGAHPAAPRPAGAGEEEQRAEDRDLRDRVETAMEDLRHRDPAGKGSGAPLQVRNTDANAGANVIPTSLAQAASHVPK